MAYVALYRKYRSQDFEDVIGQEHVTRTLQNAIERGKIGQAFLFTGSRGCGKTTVARLLAKAVNCESGPTAHPCNKCPSCLAITRGAAVDVAEVDAASNRGVAEMEAICESVRYQPMEARYRVVILDEAHQLSDHAKDAFLKTLEEPPPHAIFVLATTEPSKIPITIRSRCQQFDFHRGTLTQVEDRLKWVCEREEVAISDEAARLIASHAQGSWRDGLSLLEQVIAFSGGGVNADDTRKALGAVPEEVPAAIVEAIAANDAGQVILESRKSWSSGADPARLLAAVVEYCRDRLEDAIAGRQANPAVQRLGAERLIKLIYSLADSESALRNWERADLAIEVALLSAMASAHQTAAPPAQAVAPDEPVRSPAATQAGPGTNAADPHAPKPPPSSATEERADALEPDAPPAAAGEVNLEMLVRAWPRVIQRLRADRANTSLCAILKDGQPSEYEGNTLTIVFPEGHSFHASRTQASAEKVAAAFQQVAGAQVKLKAQAADAPGHGAARPSAQPTEKRSGRADGSGAASRQSPKAAEKPDTPDEAETPTTEIEQEVLRTFGGQVLDDQDPF